MRAQPWGRRWVREIAWFQALLNGVRVWPLLPEPALQELQFLMTETIDLGSLTLKFLQSKDTTDGSADVFEMTLLPNARMPIPHYHDNWDETIYGLAGMTTFRVDGKDIDIRAGETVFIKRGVVHGFTNHTAKVAKCLCLLSPGVLGPQYFRDMAKLLAGGSPDPVKMKETMLRYGLIPVPSSA